MVYATKNNTYSGMIIIGIIIYLNIYISICICICISISVSLSIIYLRIYKIYVYRTYLYPPHLGAAPGHAGSSQSLSEGRQHLATEGAILMGFSQKAAGCHLWGPNSDLFPYKGMVINPDSGFFLYPLSGFPI